MEELYRQRTRHRDGESALGVEYAELDDLLSRSAFITRHPPMSEETRHLIGTRELGLMKPRAVLVNIARGGVVDHDALYEAMRVNKIAAVALDVTDPEPIPSDHPLLSLDNVLVVPHLGSATVQTRTKMVEMACENLLAGLSGHPAPYSVFR